MRQVLTSNWSLLPPAKRHLYIGRLQIYNRLRGIAGGMPDSNALTDSTTTVKGIGNEAPKMNAKRRSQPEKFPRKLANILCDGLLLLIFERARHSNIDILFLAGRSGAEEGGGQDGNDQGQQGHGDHQMP